jgi:predicted tellurium resistance membrane protein TerC
VVGAAAALAASWVGFEYRRRVPLPGIASALVEDVVAAASGAFIIRQVCG